MIEAVLTRIRIVLVEPTGDRNIGSIARVMKNMGLEHLILVNPQCDYRSEAARHMAVHAPELLETAQVVNTLPEALQGCQKAIATTGLDHDLPTPLESPRIALPWLLDSPSALIFGREDRGLTNQELNLAQRLIQIPTSPVYPSLNLAQAVGICCYELFQAAQSTDFNINQPTLDLADFETLEGLYQQLETLLLEIGYLYPHTALSRMEKFRRLGHRAQPTTPEVAMLRGILSQMTWALRRSQ